MDIPIKMVNIKYVCRGCGGKVFKTPAGRHGLGKWHCENNCDPCKVEVKIDHGKHS